MALVIYVTIGSKGDEKSKYGYTIYQSSYAYTHIGKYDINICTPLKHLRYFPDTLDKYFASEIKKNDINFLTLADDYSIITAYSFPEEIKEINEESISKRLEDSLGSYELASEPKWEMVTLAGNEYLKLNFCAKDKTFLDYSYMVDYFTMHDGQCIEIKCFMEGFEDTKDSDDAIKYISDNIEPLIEKITFGPTDFKPGDENIILAKWHTLNFAPWVLLVPFVYALFVNMTFMGFSEKIYDVKKKRYRFVSDEGTGFNEDFLSLNISKMILGFFSVLVVFHHLVQHAGVTDSGLISFLEDFGVCFVGAFFFFSGFGLYESFKNKKNYLKGFLLKRLPSILIPFLTVTAVFVLDTTAQNVAITPKQLLLWFSGINLINPHMWYIVEIVILYVLFFLLFRFIKNQKICIALLFIAVGLMITYSLLLCHGDGLFMGEWWYNTTLLFPIGILFSYQKDNVTYLLKYRYKIILPITIVGFYVFYKLTKYVLINFSYWSETATDKGYDDKLLCLSMQYPMVIFFVLLMLLIGLKFKIGNWVLKFLGDISLELYLIHYLFFSIFSSIKGTGAFFTSVLVSSILAAAVLHLLHQYIFSFIYKKTYPQISKLKHVLPDYIAGRKEEYKAFKIKVNKNISFTKTNKKLVGKLLFRHLFCVILCITSFIPVLLLVVNATQSRLNLISKGVSLLPGGQFAENLLEVKSYLSYMGLDLYKIIGMSCFISITTTLIGTYIGGLCAYGFECYSFEHKKPLWGLVIASMMVPAAAVSVGFLKLVEAMHLYNHLLPIILVGISIPACVYFMRMYLHTLSLKEIIEYARIDGCREITIFNKIILPIIRPAIYLQLIINFANSWNNTLYQNLILIDIHKKSISVFLNSQGNGSGSDPSMYCFLLVATMPSLIILIVFSRGLTAHINLGAVKE